MPTTIAELRFGDSYRLRYDPDDPNALRPDFAARFAGSEESVSIYAMATRQVDVLAEYMTLYRVLEAADGANGTRFARRSLADLPAHDFGALWIEHFDHRREPTDAFDVYRRRASEELARLLSRHGDFDQVSQYLYGLRNRLAHGRREPVVGDFGPMVETVSRALPLVKLLARMAIER